MYEYIMQHTDFKRIKININNSNYLYINLATLANIVHILF